MSTSSNKFPGVFYQDNGKPIAKKPIVFHRCQQSHIPQQNIDDMLELHNQLVVALPNRSNNCRQRIFKGCIDIAAAEAKSTEDLKHEYLQVRHTKHKHRSAKISYKLTSSSYPFPKNSMGDKSDITIQSNDAKAKPIVTTGKGKAFTVQGQGKLCKSKQTVANSILRI